MTRLASKHMRQQPPPQQAPQPSAPSNVVDPAHTAASEPLGHEAEPAKSNGHAKTRELERVIKLEFPVEFAGMTYDTLTVRRLKTRDLRVMDTERGEGMGHVEAGIRVLALICDVDEAIIDELDMVDYIQVQTAVADFFPQELVASLQAGLSRSPQT